MNFLSFTFGNIIPNFYIDIEKDSYIDNPNEANTQVPNKPNKEMQSSF